MTHSALRRLLRPTYWAVLLTAVFYSPKASATVPYGGVVPGTPGLGPGIQTPATVPGKEYTHDLDHEIIAAGTALDPEQLVAWDGSGGVADGLDFTGERALYPDPDEVDAIANHGDFLFEELMSESAHLIFSFDDFFTVISFGIPSPAALPPTGPITLGNGNMVGGAAELSYELGLSGGANPPDFQALWASDVMINAMPGPMGLPAGLEDVDGVEVWGPEPAFTADTNKYSLDIDDDNFGTAIAGDAVSIWNSPAGSAYLGRTPVVAAVTSLLGPLSGFLPNGGDAKDGEAAVNLDALMVHDVNGSTDTFDSDPTGGSDHDKIIFSIRQIVDPVDPDGFYATGSELFVLDAAGGASFLTHGGHPWDHAYALSTFAFFMDPINKSALDINAIEAVAEFTIPEPSSLVLAGVLLVGGVSIIRRHRSRLAA